MARETWENMRARWAEGKSRRQEGRTRDATEEDPTEDSEGRWNKAREGAGKAWDKTKEGAGRAREGATKANDKTKDWARQTQEGTSQWTKDQKIKFSDQWKAEQEAERHERDHGMRPSNVKHTATEEQRRSEGSVPPPSWGWESKK